MAPTTAKHCEDLMNPKSEFDWYQFRSYRVFDEFVQRFMIERRSYITNHQAELDFDQALRDIYERFVEAADESEANFDEKVAKQFHEASTSAKVVFSNVEYLWAMPMDNIGAVKKSSYAQRWFGIEDVKVGDKYYFASPHGIANPGSYYLRNKYWELIALFQLVEQIVVKDSVGSLEEAKQKLAELCHSAVYGKNKNGVIGSRNCGVYSAIMHLSDPERFESIISAAHRQQICAVFRHVVESPSADQQILLKQIRAALFDSHGSNEDPMRKYRWFFYSRGVESLWIGRKTKRAQDEGAVLLDVDSEQDAVEVEGDRVPAGGYRVRRSSKLVSEAKRRDKYACRSCGFHFVDKIVHVHHLDPLSELKRPTETKLKDLVTLCPNCHYLAHFLLRDSFRYRELEFLLKKLKSLNAQRSVV